MTPTPKGPAMSHKLKQRAREAIERLAALDSAKKPGGGIHGQVVGCEPWVIRTNGDGLQCLHDAQVLLEELLDPFGRRATVPAAQQAGWVSVDERLPEVGELVLVYAPAQRGDYPDDVRISFDCIDPNDDDHASWLSHNEHYEHYCCVAKPEGSTGPSEKAPYTHWMPLPSAPGSASAPADAASVRDRPTVSRVRDQAIEEAAKACEAWGNAKVAKWQDDPEMSEDAKARAWDALQCAAAIRALQGKPEAASTCAWTLNDPDSGSWQSSCGEAWVFMDGGPKENSVRFCQGCGKPVAIEAAKGGEHG